METQNLQEIIAAVMTAIEAKRPPVEQPRRSESIAELIKALAEARPKIKSVLDASQEAKIASKDPNKKGWSYNYEDLPEILNAIYPSISEHGLEAIARIHRGRSGPILTVELHHMSGQWIASEIQLKECNDPKEFAGQITSYRRALLKALLNLASRDPEKSENGSSSGTYMLSASYGGQALKKQQNNPSDQRSRVNVAMKQLNLARSEVEELINNNGLPPVIDMTVEQGDALVQLMQAKKKEKEHVSAAAS